MAFAWGVLAIGAVMLVLTLIYRSVRRRRESLVLAFTDRIGLSVTTPIIDMVDRRIQDRSLGYGIGGLTALLGFGMVILVDFEFIPTGLAGFATSGIFVAAMATGGAISALRQFAAPQGTDAWRVARLDAPSFTDYVHPAWAWTAATGAVIAVVLTSVLLIGDSPSNTEAGGLPIAGVAVLATLSIVGIACASFLSRWLLAIPQPASDELELQWDDALRAYALRDIWVASIGLSAATIVAAFSWILDYTSPFYFAAALIGAAPLILFGLPPSKRSSRRLWQPVSAEI